jgi:hypothetical protein
MTSATGASQRRLRSKKSFPNYEAEAEMLHQYQQGSLSVTSTRSFGGIGSKASTGTPNFTHENLKDTL